MKKALTMALSFVLLLSFAACGNSNSTPPPASTPAPAPSDAPVSEPADDGASTPDEASADEGSSAPAGEGNILVAYFGVMETDGVDTVAGASRVAVDGELYGNMQFVSNIIQSNTGGEIFAIETVQAYPTTHQPLLDVGAQEKAENARPELSSQIENPDAYDVIFLGYPNWNADMPMALYSFLEAYDFSGKTIIPFTVHGGSGLSGTVSSIASLQPNATVETNALSISRNSVAGSEGDVVAWLQSLGYA